MKYLLDTCAFLWVSQQPKMLSVAAKAAINDQTSELFVSDVSLWEITLKHSTGKLPLPKAPRLWIPEKIAFHQFKPLPVNHECLYLSGELPRVHADPFDRLIAAHAIAEGMTLLSPDTPLSDLGASRIW
ncbi:MAG: type II toxin-antitoxin system VapC family toxin [Verrucomicrobiaceae bacterium]|nr:type II toxin-antitoxin system VapC family toxin [Verrucomicrobiaceae bacterium]